MKIKHLIALHELVMIPQWLVSNWEKHCPGSLIGGLQGRIRDRKTNQFIIIASLVIAIIFMIVYSAVPSNSRIIHIYILIAGSLLLFVTICGVDLIRDKTLKSFTKDFVCLCEHMVMSKAAILSYGVSGQQRLSELAEKRLFELAQEIIDREEHEASYRSNPISPEADTVRKEVEDSRCYFKAARKIFHRFGLVNDGPCGKYFGKEAATQLEAPLAGVIGKIIRPSTSSETSDHLFGG